MAKKTKNSPLELDLFQVIEQYPEHIVKHKSQANIDKLDATKHVLICNVKKNNVEKFLDGSATLYYTGKKFPSTVALNKLYYFVPYIGKNCGKEFSGIRDLYLIKVARVGSRREGEIDNDPNDLFLIGDSGGFLLNINDGDKFVNTHLLTESADFYRQNKQYKRTKIRT